MTSLNEAEQKSRYNSGLLAGVGAYLIWGVIPLYWQLLKPASAPEILAHRVVWSFGLLLVIVYFRNLMVEVKATFFDKQKMLLIFFASILITINWGVFIWAVNNGHIIETSLGYFINPLVSVALGVIVLKEKLRSLQKVAVGLTFIAVSFLTLTLGNPPYIALSLAFSFGFYGLVKKMANVNAIPSLTIETLLLTPFFSVFLFYLDSKNELSFVNQDATHSFWLATAGIVTVIPLLLFGTAVVRIPLVVIGLLQALGPILQFLIGYIAFNEPMSSARWTGFMIVWLAVSVFSYDAIKSYQNNKN
ncbi:MAG: EamA family transporter RarD [Candidatus Nanopelagicales bacterium]|nr:EamA family transporter RarD [Candidatus Nanopelagicales bacterium]MBJ7394061.1 EamA family transporter RarD [Candidatus Nanopelagicales bacterium]